MADQLKSARITGASLASDLPARVSELEAALSAITGIPLDVLINNPMNEVVAAGLRKVILQDAAGDPAAAGELVRNGNSLKFHNGLNFGTIPQFATSNSSITVANTTGPSNVLLVGIPANGLGIIGRFRVTAIGNINIRANHILTIATAIQGVANLALLPIAGGSTTDRVNLRFRAVAELWMNGASNSERGVLELTFPQAGLGIDSPGIGTGGGSNTGISISDSGVDMAIARVFQIYVNWSNADPGNLVRFDQFTFETLA